jgi:hypothetical protein
MPFFFAPTRDKRAKANTVLAEHGLPPGTRCASLCRIKMRRKHPQVLGVDLNRSESRQAAGPSTTGRYFAGNFTTPKAHGVRELRKKPI